MRLARSIFLALTLLPVTSMADDVQVRAQRVAHGGVDTAGRAEVFLPVPIEEVAAIVEDYSHYADFLPEFHASRVLATRGDRARAYIEVGILHDTATLWAQVNLLKSTSGDSRTVSATMTEGNVSTFAARWELRSENGGTRVVFTLAVDPGMPVPSSLIAGENVRFAERCLYALAGRLRHPS